MPINIFKLPDNIINDQNLLQSLKDICFTDVDLRSGWVGPGIPKTNDQKIAPFAKWALEHWYMYESFLNDEIMRSSGEILDIGCGIGYATINLATLLPQYRITGIDNDKSGIAFAKKYNSQNNIHYIDSDFFKLKKDKKYTYVFALEVYEHLPPLLHDLFIEKCLSTLAPGGKIFFTTPNELDEKDAEYGHIGFLNRSRAKKFIAKYRPNIVTESFINNKELLTGDIDKYVTNAPIDSFESQQEKKSHFRLCLTVPANGQHKMPRYWYTMYLIYGKYLYLKSMLRKIIKTLLGVAGTLLRRIMSML